ncbi:hypothetical protein ACLKA7_008346 [Drosophila subpalustris]
MSASKFAYTAVVNYGNYRSTRPWRQVVGCYDGNVVMATATATATATTTTTTTTTMAEAICAALPCAVLGRKLLVPCVDPSSYKYIVVVVQSKATEAKRDIRIQAKWQER